MFKESDEFRSDQLIVRVWKACNFKCNFCNVSDNERNVEYRETVKDMVRNFHYKLKYSDYKEWFIEVTLSWWEPSLFKKECIFILKYMKSIFKKLWVKYTFGIQTNASFIDKEFALVLKKLWVQSALVSFHTHDKKNFEETIQVKFEKNFKSIWNGMKNFDAAWIEVNTNTILSNQNKEHFFDTIVYLYKSFPFISSFNIGLVQPHWEAEKNFTLVVPHYKEVYQIYNKAIFYLNNLDVKVISHYVWLPLCYNMRDSFSLEKHANLEYRSRLFSSKWSLINNINDRNKVQTDECNNCVYNNVCSWIWREYVGIQKLRPHAYSRIFYDWYQQDLIEGAYILKNTSLDLKKVYNKGVKQIIIRSSLFHWEWIYNKLKEATKIGFIKITLVIDSDFLLNNKILQTGVSNIQLKIDIISIDTIKMICDFSEEYKPQFRIDLDIFITWYNKKNIHNIWMIIKILPSNFIKLFFINNYSNPSIYKYKKLLQSLHHLHKNIFTVNFHKDLLYKKWIKEY